MSTPESVDDRIELKVVGKSGQISLGKSYAGKTLRLEREILKKAAAFFAKENG